MSAHRTIPFETTSNFECSLALIGRIRFVNDIFGIAQVAFVLLYWIYGTFTSLFLMLLPQYYDGTISAGVIFCECSLSLLMLI